MRLELKELRASVRKIQATTLNLERKMDIIINLLERQNDVDIDTKYTMPTLPLQTPGQLQKFNDELHNDETYLTQVVN